MTDTYLAQVTHQRDQARDALKAAEDELGPLRRENLTLRDKLATATAELAALHQGEEPYEDERVTPSPAQWIWAWNRATPERRLEISALFLELQPRLNELRWERGQLHERAEGAEARISAAVELGRHLQRQGDPDAAGVAQRFLLKLGVPWHEAGVLAVSGAADVKSGPSIPVSAEDVEDWTLTARYLGPPVRRCPYCGDAEHRAQSCEEAEAARHPLRDWLADAYQKAIKDGCDHRDPNRLGHRPSDLATVCSCGEVVFPSPLPFGPASTRSYADQVNAPLRPETVAAISRALQDGTAPRRKVQVPHTKSGPPVPVSSEDLGDWSLTARVEHLGGAEEGGRISDLINRYAGINFELLRDQEEQAIASALTAAGLLVVRTKPTDEVAVNLATLGRLRAALAAADKHPWTPAPVGALTGWNVVRDDSIPDGEVHFRPRLIIDDTVPDTGDKP